jgi:hypothetical protein
MNVPFQARCSGLPLPRGGRGRAVRARPHQRGRSRPSTLLLTAALASLFVILLITFALWLRLRPAPGDWTVRVPLVAGLAIDVSVPRTIQFATDPAVARWLHRRTIATPAGALRFAWRADTETLLARCAPCRVRVGGLGSRPVELHSATVSVRRLDDRRYAGEFASGQVVTPWRARLTRQGLEVSGELAPTPIADVYALLSADVPELRRARIDGDVAGRWRAEWPSGRWAVQPRITGFVVDGLGTEVLATARPPARCAAPRPARRPSPWLARAVIAAEDSRYFEHPGYDLDSALQSFDGNQREGRALGGASTLTQQLAKLVYTGDDRTPARKLRELLYAVEMERTLGKARILDLYLAMAPWGDGVCGAHQAALRHIGKPAHALDASEAARLAILLRNPQAPEDPARVDAVLRSLKQRPQAAAAVRERPGSGSQDAASP